MKGKHVHVFKDQNTHSSEEPFFDQKARICLRVLIDGRATSKVLLSTKPIVETGGLPDSVAASAGLEPGAKKGTVPLAGLLFGHF
jgi:hypothetical protein